MTKGGKVRDLGVGGRNITAPCPSFWISLRHAAGEFRWCSEASRCERTQHEFGTSGVGSLQSIDALVTDVRCYQQPKFVAPKTNWY